MTMLRKRKKVHFNPKFSQCESRNILKKQIIVKKLDSRLLDTKPQQLKCFCLHGAGFSNFVYEYVLIGNAVHLTSMP